MRNRRGLTPFAALVLVLVGGCGGKQYANDPRPAQTLQLDAAVAGSRVVLSTRTIGAGPVRLTIANETSASQQVTVSSDQPGVLQLQTGPINPGATATVKTVLRAGRYSVSVQSSGISAAHLAVGAARPSAQNQLQLP